VIAVATLVLTSPPATRTRAPSSPAITISEMTAEFGPPLRALARTDGQAVVPVAVPCSHVLLQLDDLSFDLLPGMLG